MIGKPSKSIGSVIVEFAMIIPILLALAFGTMEMGRLMRLEQTLQGLVREGAQDGYRTCYDPINPDSCIETAFNNIQAVLPYVAPGAEVVLSLYEHKPSSIDPSLDKVLLLSIFGVNIGTGLTPRGNLSRFVPPIPTIETSGSPIDPKGTIYTPILAEFFPLTLLSQDGRQKHRVVICEVFHPFSTSSVSNFFGFSTNKVRYAVSIL